MLYIRVSCSPGLANGKAVLFRLRVCSQAASIDASLEFLAHPSRRVTGVFFMESELDAYQLAATSDGTGTVRFWEIFREETELGNESRREEEEAYMYLSLKMLLVCEFTRSCAAAAAGALDALWSVDNSNDNEPGWTACCLW